MKQELNHNTTTAETEPTMFEDVVIFTEPDIHDITACHGLPEHRLDVLEAEIIVAVTYEARALDKIDYEMRLRQLADKVRALSDRDKALLRIRFGMEL